MCLYYLIKHTHIIYTYCIVNKSVGPKHFKLKSLFSSKQTWQDVSFIKGHDIIKTVIIRYNLLQNSSSLKHCNHKN